MSKKMRGEAIIMRGAIRAQIVRPPPYRLRISVIGLRKLGYNKTETKNISPLNHFISSSTLVLQCSGAKIWKSEYSGKVSGKLGVGEWGNRWAKYARGTVGALPLPLLWCFCYLQAGNPNENSWQFNIISSSSSLPTISYAKNSVNKFWWGLDVLNLRTRVFSLIKKQDARRKKVMSWQLVFMSEQDSV